TKLTSPVAATSTTSVANPRMSFWLTDNVVIRRHVRRIVRSRLSFVAAAPALNRGVIPNCSAKSCCSTSEDTCDSRSRRLTVHEDDCLSLHERGPTLPDIPTPCRCTQIPSTPCGYSSLLPWC